MGGNGITVDAENPGSEANILAQVCSRNPRIGFVPSATGDAATALANFYAAYAKYRCRPSHLS